MLMLNACKDMHEQQNKHLSLKASLAEQPALSQAMQLCQLHNVSDYLNKYMSMIDRGEPHS